MSKSRRVRPGGGAATTEGRGREGHAVVLPRRRLRCRLDELMRQAGITLQDLAKLTGLSRELLGNLKNNKFSTIDIRALERLTAVFNLASVDELFTLDPVNIWLPIRNRGVTVHVCSTASHAQGDKQTCGQQRVGFWDLQAQNDLYEFLKRLDRSIDVRFATHVADNPAVGLSLPSFFDRGNHIILGSPLVGPLPELVVAHLYRQPPFTPERREAFPYGFVWNEQRTVRSSFGWLGVGGEFGIMDMRSRQLAARRTIVPAGEGGHDCSLIVVHRVSRAPKFRTFGPEDENIIIVILGYSGCGTRGGAQLLTDFDVAAELYPTQSNVPVMRVVDVTYTSSPGPTTFDNRQVSKADLVAESTDYRQGPAPPAPAPAPPGGPGGTRRRNTARTSGTKTRPGARGPRRPTSAAAKARIRGT